MKVFDQLAGAFGSLNLRKEERRKRKEEMNEETMLRGNDVMEEKRERDGMVEMFRKSIQELENGNTSQMEETQEIGGNNMQGMKKWGRMGNLNMSQGSGMMVEGSARSRMVEGKTTSRVGEDLGKSGRVKKATKQRGEVEVLRFLSLKLVREELSVLYFILFL